MAGPMGHFVYTDDLGDAHRIRMSVLDANLQGGVAATNQPPLAKGVKPRRRYLRNPTSGGERSIVALDVASAFWTDPIGATVNTVDYSGLSAVPPTTATAAFVLEGRTGERTKAI